MKKIAAILMILMLLSSCALGFTGSGYPAWDGASAPDDSFCGMFGADALTLAFDPDPTYSSIADGLLTACFFAFDGAEQNYLEMYLVLPEDVSAGSVYTSRDAGDASSISLYEVSKGGEVLYFAGQPMGAAYPGGTDYEIRIEEVAQAGANLNVRGSLSATLRKIEDSYITDAFLKLENASFQFTLALQDAPGSQATMPPQATTPPQSSAPVLPENTQAPAPKQLPATKAPAYTMDPHPAFTLPPDYRVI